MSSTSLHSSPHSSNDNYSDASSVSSTRSAIKPTTPISVSSPSRAVAFAEHEQRESGQHVGWKITSSGIMSDNDQDVHAPMRYPPRVTAGIEPANAFTHIVAGISEKSGAAEAVVLGCTQFIKTGECAYGDACKYSHALLSSPSCSPTSTQGPEHKHNQRDLIAQALEHSDGVDYPTIPQEAKRAIDHQLRKTKMCHAFNKGKCDYGYACRFAHIAGHDAYQILSKANSAKNCPFQLVLGTCSTKGKGCYFKHTPVKRNKIVKGKINKNTAPKAYQAHIGKRVEEGQIAPGGSRSGASEQEDGEFEREINDLIDLGEGLRDVYVSRE